MPPSAILRAPRGARRGSALVLVLVFTTALAMLALSAIYLTSSATILNRSYERESDLRYVAEAGLALGKSRLNSGASVLPTTGYSQIMRDTTLVGADGQPISDIRLNVYIGPTGGGAGSRGRFASVVAEARDPFGGGRFVRRVELAEESFARFAYFTDQEMSATRTPIYFGRGDILWGPVWSNDSIRLTNVGTGPLATFQREVGTAAVVVNPTYGVFNRGFRERQAPIPLPDTRTLSPRLRSIAATGGMVFTPPTSDSLPAMRVEFFAMDMNADGDSTDANEGFFKVYEVGSTGPARVKNAEWLAGTFRVVDEQTAGGGQLRWANCGDWHQDGGEWKFYPLQAHAQQWFYDMIRAGTGDEGKAKDHTIGRKSYTGGSRPAGFPVDGDLVLREGKAKPQEIMTETSAPLAPAAGRPRARCYLGGDPHLIQPAMSPDGTVTAYNIGGTATTTYGLGAPDAYGGTWKLLPSTPNGDVVAARTARRLNDGAYVFPLHPDYNGGSLGVVHFAGSVGVSGVVNGGVTMYSDNTVLILDDVTYATSKGDPARACNDILGIIAADNVLVADNGLNTPQDVNPQHTAIASTAFVGLDNPDQLDLELQGVVMALNTSFRVQNYTLQFYTGDGVSSLLRPVDSRDCVGQKSGRGCINLFGGIIQEIRGQVARSGGSSGIFGFAKQYDYDMCAATNPPPFFPTIGRFIDNRYYEVDPARFIPGPYFSALAPRTGRTR